jgi:hypothetical protein
MSDASAAIEPARGKPTLVQANALERLRRSLAEGPKRAVDGFGALFARRIADTDVPLLGMATGESQACLNHLVQRGEASVTLDAGGIAWYRADAVGTAAVH